MLTTPSRPLVEYALAYARLGWRVFPLHSLNSGDCSCGRDACTSEGKHPRSKNGVKDATCDETQIRAWWYYWPTANIGVATGLAEGATSGLYVIDVDIQKGAQLNDLQGCDLSVLLSSLTARTGSGGYHFYLNTRHHLPNTCDRLARFVDTRGEGGYVVAPPSRNRAGFYSWEHTGTVQPVPEALLLTLTCTPASGQPAKGRKMHADILLSPSAPVVPPEAQTALPTPAPASDAQAPAQSEARNNYLVGMAGRLRGQGLRSGEICAMLSALNAERYGSGRHPQGPLALEELQSTIFKSVARWEEENGVREQSLPTVTQLKDLMERSVPDPRWLVPNLLCEGLVLFAGKPKLGKSWLALSLALTCAPGDEPQNRLALGHYPVEPTEVLYLSLEDSESRFQSRVRKLLNGRPIPASFGYALSWKPLMHGGLRDLETVLSAAPSTRLVVIDTLARVRTSNSGSGSIYQEDYALMNELRELVTRHHLVLMLVHHTRKLGSDDAFDEISGSTGLTGAADTSMVLKRERGQHEATLHLTGRDVEEQELALTFDKDTCTWQMTGKAAERQQSKSRQAILDLLAERSPLTQKEIAEALSLPKGTVYSTLLRLTREGHALKAGRGLYSLPENKKAGYQLTLVENPPEPSEPPAEASAD